MSVTGQGLPSTSLPGEQVQVSCPVLPLQAAPLGLAGKEGWLGAGRIHLKRLIFLHPW